MTNSNANGIPAVISLSLVLGAKIYMVMYPLDYLGMNHETVFNYILCTFVLVVSVEFGIMITVYGTLCGSGARVTFLRLVEKYYQQTNILVVSYSYQCWGAGAETFY